MKIAVLAPVWIPIPPVGYGGIERVLKLLVDELVEMGNEVTLYAAGGSNTRARQVAYFDEGPTLRMGETLYDAQHVGLAIRDIARSGYDLVSDHSGFVGPALAPLAGCPFVHTLHGPFHPEVKRFYDAFNDDVFFIAISGFQQQCHPDLNYLGVAHNAIDLTLHRFQPSKEDYFACVGRICEAKGTHHAVRIAKETGCRLMLAGKIDAGLDKAFFEAEVRPHLDDRIVYRGEVSEAEKVKLVAGAKAFLFPIQWEEPFGLVMAEAMACGTPVITTRWGAAPEVVEHGKTGFVLNSPAEFPSAMQHLDAIDPKVCRDEAERKFGPPAMATKYLAHFREALRRSASSQPVVRIEDRAGQPSPVA
jgi:glycosyltransferase involved in cell wall biosynthesis